jgi:hypothetical protein
MACQPRSPSPTLQAARTLGLKQSSLHLTHLAHTSSARLRRPASGVVPTCYGPVPLSGFQPSPAPVSRVGRSSVSKLHSLEHSLLLRATTAHALRVWPPDASKQASPGVCSPVSPRRERGPPGWQGQVKGWVLAMLPAKRRLRVAPVPRKRAPLTWPCQPGQEGLTTGRHRGTDTSPGQGLLEYCEATVFIKQIRKNSGASPKNSHEQERRSSGLCGQSMLS